MSGVSKHTYARSIGTAIGLGTVLNALLAVYFCSLHRELTFRHALKSGKRSPNEALTTAKKNTKHAAMAANRFSRIIIVLCSKNDNGDLEVGDQGERQDSGKSTVIPRLQPTCEGTG